MSSSRAVAVRSSGAGERSLVKKRPSSQSQQPAAAAELQVIQNPHHFNQNAGIVYFL